MQQQLSGQKFSGQINDVSDGFSLNNFLNRNREQLVPTVVVCANREQKQETLMGLVGLRGRRRLKFCGVRRNYFLRCCSASESVFPGIL